MSDKLEEFRTMARKAGADGIDYRDFLHDDSICEAFISLDESIRFAPDTETKIEAAFVEGRREFRLSGGWPVAWTDARADYDQFDTEELECHEWHGRPLRKVLMNPGHAVYQRSRYMSGAAVWDEDPRETERKIRETIDRENAKAEERKRIREVGLLWLRGIEDLDLEAANEDAFDEKIRAHGLQWNDVRREQMRRDEEAAAAERVAEWNRCRSMFADGATIVDPGRDAAHGTHGVIPGRDCAVYRNVRIVPHYEKRDNVNEARVESVDGFVGLLWFVAERLTKGEYRIAKADEQLPPAVVLNRLKPSRLYHVHRIETLGQVVWAMREKYSYSSIVVLDSHGKLVRKKLIKKNAEWILQETEGFHEC